MIIAYLRVPQMNKTLEIKKKIINKKFKQQGVIRLNGD